MAKVIVNPGICGLMTTITVTSEDRRKAQVAIESECPAVQKMEEALQDIDSYTECFSKYLDSKVYEAAHKHCKHVACPVPAGIIKGIEVACGLALPRDVQITIEK